MENIYTVLITAVTVLGSTSAWRFYERRAEKKEKAEFEYKYDCRDRVAKLEALLAEAAREKDEMRKQILELTALVAKLQTQVQYLQDKNKGL